MMLNFLKFKSTSDFTLTKILTTFIIISDIQFSVISFCYLVAKLVICAFFSTKKLKTKNLRLIIFLGFYNS